MRDLIALLAGWSIVAMAAVLAISKDSDANCHLCIKVQRQLIKTHR